MYTQKKHTKNQSICASVSPGTKALIAKRAAINNRTTSQEIRLLIEAGLRRDTSAPELSVLMGGAIDIINEATADQNRFPKLKELEDIMLKIARILAEE